MWQVVGFVTLAFGKVTRGKTNQHSLEGKELAKE